MLLSSLDGCVLVILLLFVLVFVDASSADDALFNESNSSYCGNLKRVEAMITENVFLKEPRTKHWERPILNSSDSIAVKLELYLRSVADVDGKNQLVKVTGYLRVSWFDEIHRWNDTEPLNCIRDISVPWGEPTGVWLPDLAFSSADRKFELTRSETENVRIRSDGFVNLLPGNLFEFRCQFNLALFPFDSQTCLLTFESWLLQTKYQHFTDDCFISVDALHAGQNEQWRIVGWKAQRSVGMYPAGEFDWIDFYITMKRKTSYYALTIIVPCVLIAAVELATFSIAHDSTARLDLSFTCLLAYSIFNSLMNNEIPHSAENPPVLMILITVFSVAIAVAILCQGGIILMARMAKNGDPVIRLLFIVAHLLAPLVGVTRTFGTPSEKENPQTVWLFTTRVANRVACCLYVLILIASSIVLLIIIPVSARQL